LLGLPVQNIIATSAGESRRLHMEENQWVRKSANWVLQFTLALTENPCDYFPAFRFI
jgi:hypothetical protein